MLGSSTKFSILAKYQITKRITNDSISRISDRVVGNHCWLYSHRDLEPRHWPVKYLFRRHENHGLAWSIQPRFHIHAYVLLTLGFLEAPFFNRRACTRSVGSIFWQHVPCHLPLCPELADSGRHEGNTPWQNSNGSLTSHSTGRAIRPARRLACR